MGKPLLKIGPLTSLQDARSSAAVGFDLITFSLERGSMQKLSASLIWNIVQWLSGPEIVLEMNRFSLEELPQAKEMFDAQYLSFPIEEWGPDLLELSEGLILRMDSHTAPSQCQEILHQAGEKKLWFELSLDTGADASVYGPIAEQLMLHFPEVNAEISVHSSALTPGGFSMRQEAEEEAGVLDYEVIDEWLEAFNEVFEEE